MPMSPTNPSPCPVVSPARRPLLAALVAIATIAAALAARPRPARADDDRDALLVELNQFTIAVVYARDDGDRAASYFERPASACADVVRRLGAAGVKPDELIDGREP